MRKALFLIAGTLVTLAAIVGAQKKDDAATKRVAGVSTDMLVTPPPEDWLMYSRTYDAQRFSPLEFVNKRNVANLKTAWSKELPNGNHESIPIVYQGVMYLAQPGASV